MLKCWQLLLISFIALNAQADSSSNGAGALLADEKATTQQSQGTTPAVIAKSAAAKGLPKWTIPGIVQALKGSYSSLDSSTQTQVQGYVNDPDLSINQLIKKLGKITDTLSSSQQDTVIESLTNAENERREAAYAIYDSKLTDQTKELFQGLVETFVDYDLSLAQQCKSAKALVASASDESLESLGVPKSLATVDCSNLAKVLFS